MSLDLMRVEPLLTVSHPTPSFTPQFTPTTHHLPPLHPIYSHYTPIYSHHTPIYSQTTPIRNFERKLAVSTNLYLNVGTRKESVSSFKKSTISTHV